MIVTRARLLAPALIGALALGACSAGSDDDATTTNGTTDAPVSSEELIIGVTAEPPTLDLATSTAAAIPQVLLYNVHETLVKVDQNGDLVPALATEWTVSEDGRVYTFELRQGVTFTNGEDFTAEDVKFSIERVQSDEWTISQKAAMDVVASVEALGTHEVQVTLDRPSNNWLYAMSTRVGAIFSPTGLDNPAEEAVGTGPYRLGSWERDSAITLTRNDDYWGARPYFAEVVFRYFDNPTAMNNALLTDAIHVIGGLQAPESIGDFEGGDYQIIEGLTNGEVVLSMNSSRAPFEDVRVRQAVRHAIDHETLVDICWAGYGTLIGSMVPPTDPWYEDRTGDFPYDPDRARELLEEADAVGVDVAMRLPTLAYAGSCGVVVESMLEEVGFEVTIDELEFPARWLEVVLRDADYDMSIVAHVEPRDLGVVFGDPEYYTKFGTPELVELLTLADEGTPEEQVEYLRQAAELISQEAAADFLFLLPNLIVATPDITGLPENAVSESFDLSRLGRDE